MKAILIFLLSAISTASFAKSNPDSTLLLTPNICGVSVDTNNRIKKTIYWENIDINITKFIIYKKSSANLLDSIATVDAQRFNEYIDSNPQLNYYSNSYKIQALNDSGSRGALSPEAENVFLNALEFVDDSVVKLIWSIGNPSDSVIIWRRIAVPNFTIVKKLPINDSFYLDTIPWAAWGAEYRLEIIKSDPCYSSNDTTSKIRIFANEDGAGFGAVSNKSKQVIQVFPNPVNTTLSFRTDMLLLNANFKIYSSLGQMQLQNKLNNNELDVSILTEGIYYFIIETEDSIYQDKFVKSR